MVMAINPVKNIEPIAQVSSRVTTGNGGRWPQGCRLTVGSVRFRQASLIMPEGAAHYEKCPSYHRNNSRYYGRGLHGQPICTPEFLQGF
jgi:hypothetical protein